MKEKRLELKFDPRTIEHLGIKMYSQLPYALAELVANAYDAGAENVRIQLVDKNDEKMIVVEDDGDGMSYDEVAVNFLVIGRKRRAEDEKRENSVKVPGTFTDIERRGNATNISKELFFCPEWRRSCLEKCC